MLVRKLRAYGRDIFIKEVPCSRSPRFKKQRIFLYNRFRRKKPSNFELDEALALLNNTPDEQVTAHQAQEHPLLEFFKLAILEVPGGAMYSPN
jgi:hypothetical protein